MSHFLFQGDLSSLTFEDSSCSDSEYRQNCFKGAPPFMRRFLEGGTRCSGRSSGKSYPSNLTWMRCIAKANSSESKAPSPSTSANLHTLASTGLGNLDLIISFLAAEPLILPLTGVRDSKMASHLLRSLVTIHSGSPDPKSMP